MSLVSVRFPKRPAEIADELVEAIAQARVAGEDPIPRVEAVLDSAVVFDGWLGLLLEKHFDGPVFGLLAGVVEDVFDRAVDRGRDLMAAEIRRGGRV